MLNANFTLLCSSYASILLCILIYSKQCIKVSKSTQKRGFKGYYGVIGCADSEYDIC